MNHPHIAFIGAGNMAKSLIGGLIKDGYPAKQIWASNHDPRKCDELRQLYPIHVTLDNSEAVRHAEVVVFAVKPQTLTNVATDIADAIREKQPLLLSIAAGVRTHRLEKMLGGEYAIVRCMPNTAALVGSAATGIFANSRVTPEWKDLAESIMRAVGIVVWLADEKQLDIVTALSGSGPAYFFLVIEALIDAGRDLGLTPETARLLTLQTALGAAQMALQSDGDIMRLRQHVTSPGGTTEKAIEILEKGRLRQVFARALAAATQRAAELAGEKE